MRGEENRGKVKEDRDREIIWKGIEDDRIG